MSRGGKTMAFSVEGKVSTMLSFMPIQAIRSLGSILSNLKAVAKNFEGGFNKGMLQY